MQKQLVRTSFMLLASMFIPVAVHAATPSPDLVKQAIQIQDRNPTLDNHLDIPFEFGSGELDAAKDGTSQFDLPKAEQGHLKGAVVAIFVPQGARTDEGYRLAAEKGQQKLAILKAIATKYPQRVAIAESPEELKSIESSGRFAIVLSILNGHLIGKDLSQLDDWYRQGVRIFGFNHAGNNDLADSSRPNLLRGDKLDEHGGLSPLGREAVKRLNDLGIVIDVSQISGNALAQVLERTRAPVVASHSNARGIIDHPRNLDDKQLLAIKRNGGVIAINAYSSWVRPLPPEAVAKGNEIRRKYGVPEEKTVAGIQPLSEAGVKVLAPEQFTEYSKEFHAVTGDPAYRATLEEYVDQIDYVVKRIGIEHVGISSDFNHGGGVTGWKDVSESANVTAELLRRGYSEEDIAKLWGGNFLRVWARVQSLAANKRKG
jgi:microsomal dipeptidase-like Zn-dependent dipeptidase